MKNPMPKKAIIKYRSQKKTIILPNDYPTFLKDISSIFNITEQQKQKIGITTNKLSKKLTSKEYIKFLKNIQKNEIPELTINLNEYNDEFNFIEKDSYDQDELALFNNKSKSIGEEFIDLEQILNQSIEESNNELKLNNDLFKSEIPKNVVRFSSYCNICDQFPIVNIMFYCQNCDLNFCEKCEKKIGYNHRHCYYKIKNREQYEEILNIKINEIIKNRNNNYKTKNNNDNNGIFHSIIGIIKGK